MTSDTQKIKNQEWTIYMLVLLLMVTIFGGILLYFKNEIRNDITNESIQVLHNLIIENKQITFTTKEAAKAAREIKEEFDRMRNDLEDLKKRIIKK